MQKATEYRVEDSNVENIGSAMDKAQRMAAATTDVQWDGAGKEPGIEIWRVENKRTASDTPDFGIKRVPKDEYRKFFRGDSYIVLYTYKAPEGDKLMWNIHFWIGSSSTQDEYGVAAYKAVELDDMLGGEPVQYRECEGYESALFMSYWGPKGVCPGDIQYLDGGHESGFRKVKIEEYKPRLLWVRRQNKVMAVTEVGCSFANVNNGDCFILDSGNKLFLYRGEESDAFEKNQMAQVAQNIVSDRMGKSKVCEGEDDAEFYSILGSESGAKAAPPVEHVKIDTETNTKVELYSLDDDTLEFVKVADGPLYEAQIRDDDVMLITTGTRVFVSVGHAAPKQEKAAAMLKASNFIYQNKMNAGTPITRVMKGQTVIGCPQWQQCFAG